MHIIDRIYAIILSFIFLFLTICNVLTLWVVGIEGLCTVAVFQVGALLELVIAYPVHIVITVGLVAANMVKQSAEIVRGDHLFLTGGDHLQQAVVAVAIPLRDIGGDSLARHNHRASGH